MVYDHCCWKGCAHGLLYGLRTLSGCKNHIIIIYYMGLMGHILAQAYTNKSYVTYSSHNRSKVSTDSLVYGHFGPRTKNNTYANSSSYRPVGTLTGRTLSNVVDYMGQLGPQRGDSLRNYFVIRVVWAPYWQASIKPHLRNGPFWEDDASAHRRPKSLAHARPGTICTR